MRPDRPKQPITRRCSALTTTVVLLVASCGGDDDADAPEAEPSPSQTTGATVAPETQPTPTTVPEPAQSVATTVEPTATTTATGDGATPEVPAVASTFPLSDDPCASPAAHAIGGEPVEYTFTLDGDERPVGVRVGGEAALGPPPTLVAILSPPHGEWESSAGLADLIGSQIGPEESRIVVAPQPSSGPPLLWTETESFNVDYFTTLFELLERSFCLDSAKVLLGARGGATIAVAQAICSTDLPIDLAFFQLGMVTVDGCDPTRAVPILSISRFGLNPPVGPHWDGPWDPPAETELALTGGFRSVPDEVATWAEIYHCTDDAVQETLPNPDGMLEQPTLVLAHRACDAPIVAFGMQPQPGALGIVNEALAAATDRLYQEWNGLLGNS